MTVDNIFEKLKRNLSRAFSLLLTLSLVPARLINSTTYIPLRAVAEAVNASVGWDGGIKRIDINK